MRSLPNLGLLILRCTFSFLLFFNHGLDKLMNFSTVSKSFPDPIGLGSAWSAGLVVFAEAIAPIFIFFGLFTRIATIFPIVAMGVAALVFHAADPLAKKEMALLYLAAFIAIATIGPGSYSLDTKIRKVS